MNINKIKGLFNEKNKVEFKIYSLNYIIEYKDNVYIIYPKNDYNRKKTFSTIDDLFKKYEIYNENLKANEDKINFDI